MSVILERAFTADLNNPLRTYQLRDQLNAGDRSAHRFTVRLCRGDAPVTDVQSVTGYFHRPDGAAVLIQGEAQGSEVSVVLPDACYQMPGWCTLCIRVSDGEAVTTVFTAGMLVEGEESGMLLDPGEAVPSLDALLAMLAETQRATATAALAVQRTEEALGRLPTVKRDAQGNIVISVVG